jgi:hypothetical protein
MHREEARTADVADPLGGALTRTFVVRLWQPAEASLGTTLGLRGVVEHLQSGESVAFGEEGALLAFLRDAGRTM